MSQDSILILTNKRDFAADAVIKAIESSGGTVVRLNIEDVYSGNVEPWAPGASFAKEIGVVWWRQFQMPRELLETISDDELLVLRSQWRAWISTFDQKQIPWINGLWPARQAEDKISQLRAAEKIGFELLETIVTNNKTEASAFLDNGPAVAKSLSSAYYEFNDQAFFYTQDAADLLKTDTATWNSQPLILQRMAKGKDIRVICFNGKYFGASCKTPTLDWRQDKTGVKWEVWPVSKKIQHLCSEYLTYFNLRYAAFDFIQEGKNCWFLEANQAGEWSFIDRDLNLGIATELAKYLCKLSGFTKGKEYKEPILPVKVAQWIIPSIWLTYRANKKVDRLNPWRKNASAQEIQCKKDEMLKTAISTSPQTNSVQTVYERTYAAFDSLEAKAVGVLQAGALVFAVIVLVFDHMSSWQLILILPIIYLICSFISCMNVLKPKRREELLLCDLTDSRRTDEMKMARAVTINMPNRIKTVNHVTSSVEDLIKSGVITSVLLMSIIVTLYWQS